MCSYQPNRVHSLSLSTHTTDTESFCLYVISKSRTASTLVSFGHFHGASPLLRESVIPYLRYRRQSVNHVLFAWRRRIMAPFGKSSCHSHGRSFKSLYLNPMNELKGYEDRSSWEINLHVYESSVGGLSVLPLPSERGKQPKEDDGGCVSGSQNRSVTAPASAWSTLPKRSLLYRPLPEDIGSCSCYIVREMPEGRDGFSLYTLYTNEGQGRVDQRLALAYHRRKWGRSEYIIAQNSTGIKCRWDESFVGTVTANLMGSYYHIWDQSSFLDSPWKDSKQLVAIVTFLPTITTLTGSLRKMHVYVPKFQTAQTKSSLQTSKQHELDFRDKTRSDICIQSSSKNFQLVMKDDDGRQTILLLGKISKSKYLVDYRYPLTDYQAFAICLASIDSKLCYCI